MSITRAMSILYPNAALVRYDADADTIEAWDEDESVISIDRAVVDARAALEEVRAERNERLSATDWWVLPDRTATQAQLDYRQALRDITDTYTSLDDVVWPTKP